MKKFFFSLVALAALAACSKSEIAYEQTGEIAFSPVAKSITKSVAGYDYGTSDTYHTDGNDGEFDGVFPTGVNLYVFANAQDENTDGVLQDSWTSPYFKNALFVHTSTKGTEGTQNSVPTTGAYAGDPTRYWPNVKTLKFVGYSDACNVSTLTPTVADDLSTLTINGYVQDNSQTGEGKNDLMWFPVTQAYGKAEGEIPAQMKHACSWITINVAGDATTKDNWILNSLVVTDFAHTGTATCGTTTATWDSYSDVEPEDYYNAQTTSTFNPQQGTTFTDGYVEYYKTAANNFIVIPQEPTTLEVTYSYKSDTDIWFHETKVINLDYDGVEGENAKWQSGVHYIYNLTITATEILIDPVVVEWTTNTPTIPAI